MLQISFFSKEIIEDYIIAIADKVKERNNSKDYISFIPNGKKDYTISINDLLTKERKNIINIEGIKLYIYICSLRKYINMSNVEFLHSLYKNYPSKIKEHHYENGNYEYEINNVTYISKRKDDKSINQSIIGEATEIIKDELSKYDTKYCLHYFAKKTITSMLDLSIILEAMLNDLHNLINGCNNTHLPIIVYELINENLRHKLMNSIGLRTCPYCNRNYITKYGINGSKSTADLDHFYQKEQYPLFALSLFNFVPSCAICNSRMKNIHPATDTLYPYEEGFDEDVHFELKFIGKNQTGEKILHIWQALSNIDYSDFVIDLVIDTYTCLDKRKKIEKSKEIFRLLEVYADHKQDALETALRTRIYCEGSYENYCQKLMSKLSKVGMKYTSVSDLKNFMFRNGFDSEWLMFGMFMNDEKRRYDKPLSRMIYDIYNSEK